MALGYVLYIWRHSGSSSSRVRFCNCAYAAETKYFLDIPRLNIYLPYGLKIEKKITIPNQRISRNTTGERKNGSLSLLFKIYYIRYLFRYYAKFSKGTNSK